MAIMVADHDKIKIGQQCLLFKSHGLYDVTLDFLQNRNEWCGMKAPGARYLAKTVRQRS